MITNLSSLSDRQQQSVTRLYWRDWVEKPWPKLSRSLILLVGMRKAPMGIFPIDRPTTMSSSSSSVTRTSRSSSLIIFDCALYLGGLQSPHLIFFFDIATKEDWVANTAKSSMAQDSPISSNPLWLILQASHTTFSSLMQSCICDYSGAPIRLTFDSFWKPKFDSVGR